ncbi:MAG: hypothetical protein LBE92_01150 [Chryseobacterium sp.]|jgi:hypothetical protein|uniref:hypothetical protein n=1 Tax=Chryseobacterium sp. TaxID=1871047 RepID=UPI00281957AC|nr:hypothetical protein [Chryseobacterium sp.]MDR2234705.1 hypothetical protein [Chryseobacterium sp.]
MKKIIIKKSANPNMNILSVLKSLYMEGSEINSLEKIANFKKTYEDVGEVNIIVTNEALNIFKGYFSDGKINYEIE